jgi:hypothetical protein
MRDNTILLAAAPVEWIQAEMGVDAGDKRLKQFAGVAYTGGAMKANYRQPVVIDLAGLTAASESIPFLYQHDPSQIVGHGVAAIGPDSIRVSGQVSGVGQAASEVTALAANGFRWQMSVGVSPSRIEQVDAGATATANGRQFTGPAVIVRAGELREVSFVAIGADGRTAASVAASYRGAVMTYEQWLQARGWDAAQLTAEQSATLRAAYDAEQAPPAPPAKPIQAAAPPVDVSAIVASAVSQAMAAARDQQEAAAVLASFESRVEPQALAGIRASATSQGWNRDRVELECRRAARPEAPAIHVTASAINPEALEVGILRASSNVGSAYLERTYRPEVLAAADAPAYRRMTLHKLLGTVASAGGVYAHPGDKESLVEAAFKAQQKLLTFDAFSTVNLSGILSNTANKAMLASYLAVGATWNRIAAVRSHSDFKVNTLYRMDADGAFKKVGANGELKLSSFSETSFTKQLSTFGTIISLTRRDMVNDDLGAFLQIAQQLGRMAAIRIEEAVYVLLLGSINSTLFTSGNGNYLTGAGALSLTSLAALAAKFNDQVDSQGKPVLIQPRVLLVGSAIKTTAENLFNETVVVGSTTADKLQPARNPFAGLYEPVSSPYVNNTRIRDQDGVALSGQTSTGFGLFADPAERAALGVAFLNGAQSPTIQSGETDFAQLGMQFRGYIDFGVGLEDPTAAAWSTGT